jgi:hypothetical protein
MGEGLALQYTVGNANDYGTFVVKRSKAGEGSENSSSKPIQLRSCRII